MSFRVGVSVHDLLYFALLNQPIKLGSEGSGCRIFRQIFLSIFRVCSDESFPYGNLAISSIASLRKSTYTVRFPVDILQ